MEVYVENNETSKGRWIELPLRTKVLKKVLQKEHLETEEGEYQTMYLRVWNLPVQPCNENLFLLNEKVKAFYEMSQIIQEKIIESSLEEGITIEDALFSYL